MLLILNYSIFLYLVYIYTVYNIILIQIILKINKIYKDIINVDYFYYNCILI